MWDVFVSYNRADVATMQLVRDALRNYGLLVWTDAELIPGTPAWEREIGRAIEDTQCLVVLMSPNSKESEWVNREINFARSHRLAIIPVLAHGEVQKAVPFSLSDYQRIDIRFDPRKELNTLITTIEGYIRVRTASSGRVEIAQNRESIHDSQTASETEQTESSEVSEPIQAERLDTFPVVTGVKLIALDSLVDFHPVNDIPRSEQKPGKYPLYSVTGIQSYIDSYQFDGKHLVIPRVISSNTPVAFAVDGRFSGTSSLFVLTPRENVTLEYLIVALRRINLHGYQEVSGIPRINKSKFSESRKLSSA